MRSQRDRIRLTLCAGRNALRERSGTDVIVLPELFDGGYAALERGTGMHHQGDELLRFCADASRRRATTIVAGSVCLARGRGRATNTSLVFTHGRLRHRYDKIHLFRPVGDVRHFARGGSAHAFTLPLPDGGRRRAAVILCYDLRFPELARALALQGTEILFVPARWPSVRDHAWRTLLRARAIENQCFVVGCNAPDREGGRSYVYGPGGEELLARRLGPGQKSVRLVLEMSWLDRARRLHRSLREAVVLEETTFPRWVRGRRGRR